MDTFTPGGLNKDIDRRDTDMSHTDDLLDMSTFRSIKTQNAAVFPYRSEVEGPPRTFTELIFKNFNLNLSTSRSTNRSTNTSISSFTAVDLQVEMWT